MRGSATFQRSLRFLPVLVAISFLNSFAADPSLERSEQERQRERPGHGINKPHVPPWSVSRPPVPSQTPQVTPGGTFSRPGSTFSPQTGTFSRPQSTFAHPASSYTPLPPIQVPVEDPDHTVRPHHPHGRRPVNLYPQTVVVHNPVVYEPYYVEVPVPVETATPQESQAPAEAPVVIDLPPGATIRRPAAAGAATSPASPVVAPAVNPQPAGQATPSSRPISEISTTAQAAATPSVAK